MLEATVDRFDRTVRCASTLVERRHLGPSGPRRTAQPTSSSSPSGRPLRNCLLNFLPATLAGPPIGMLKGVEGVLVRHVCDVQSSVIIVVGPLAFQPGGARPGAS